MKWNGKKNLESFSNYWKKVSSNANDLVFHKAKWIPSFPTIQCDQDTRMCFYVQGSHPSILLGQRIWILRRWKNKISLAPHRCSMTWKKSDLWGGLDVQKPNVPSFTLKPACPLRLWARVKQELELEISIKKMVDGSHLEVEPVVDRFFLLTRDALLGG